MEREREEVVESPRKRLKIDDTPAQGNDLVTALPSDRPNHSREAEVGITEFVSTDIPGFEGILKKRYTDFLVNEILPSGEVLHLRSTSVPANISSRPEKNAEKDKLKTSTDVEKKNGDGAAQENDAPPKPFEIGDDDLALLKSLFGDEAALKIIDFHASIHASPNTPPRKFGQIEAGVVENKDVRTKMHINLRRIFNSLLESKTDADNNMIISAAPNRHNKSPKIFRGESGHRVDRSKWDELGGTYMHFTIYKENKDTMEVVSFLARQLKMNAKSFQFAGTKDRRGVTVQRACVFKVFAERLMGLNKSLRNATLGDFEYRKYGMELGQLEGNEFIITLRDCQFPRTGEVPLAVEQAKELVGSAMRNLRDRGYLNYYGLQRFGTYARGTHEIGIKMLQGDFRGAVDMVLDYNPQLLDVAQGQDTEGIGPLISSDDKARAEAIHIFKTTRSVGDALRKLPRKFSAETSIIRHLGREPNNYLGALQDIPRNLRLMYVHAYQSLVWNFAAGERWRLYGGKVVEGDLVIVDTQQKAATNEAVDADGEIVVAPHADDTANAVDTMFTRARPLSAEEAASGEFTIFDIVLPLPGYDVLYPANQMTDFYKRFMASEQGGGLDPFDMRRKWRDISLSGSYRKLLSRPGAEFSYDIQTYSVDDQQFVQTDMEALKGGQPEPLSNEGQPEQTADKIAVVLKFQLGSSQYATMALRELMKMGGVREYKPDYGGRKL
ncbi:putative pseudouridine synthase TruD/Pus7 [Talaromyces proteolyticus]|uniref:Pseudouridine synthase TruD/Pus7 n=1 Tax=Talaromyces proteolyticus TaxID=1131652 RepID=A0AAD4KUP2_9EURO|nr:putative pseudouridine synthase TruD/Pus7 [Talaromyces proteolyticus]KAH8699160.1 putative pseudouridine synthase TruD/Pus7 [Talaromyces proteolyticus]